MTITSNTSPGFIDEAVSLFVQSQFPHNFQVDGPLLVKFIQYYYQWLEQSGNATDAIRRLTSYTDIDTSPTQFYTFLRDEFMQNIPSNLQVNDRLLAKHILDFYRAKGDQGSYRLLFRILFNEEIDFYYPATDILRASDGHWVIEKTLQIFPINGYDPTNNANLFLTFTGSDSKAYAEMTDYREFFSTSGVLTRQLYLTNIRGDFIENETLLSQANNASIALVLSNGIQTSPGSYVGTTGFLSGDKYLEDNFFYQPFSYVLKASQPIGVYKDVVKKIVHPSGTEIFGQVTITPVIDFQPNANTISISLGQSGNTVLDFNTTIDPLAPINYVLGSSFASTPNEFLVYLPNLEFYPTIPASANVVFLPTYITGGDGWVSISSNTEIGFYAPYRLQDLYDVPMDMTGSSRLIIGLESHFEAQSYTPSVVTFEDFMNITNLFSNENLFNTSPWSLVGASISQNSKGPDLIWDSGWTLTASSTSSYLSGTLTTNQATIYSLYVKQGTSKYIYFNTVDTGGQVRSSMDIGSDSQIWGDGSFLFGHDVPQWTTTNVTVSGIPTVTHSNFTINSLQGDWFRVGFSISGAITRIDIGLADADNSSVCSSGDTVSIYRAQLVSGATPYGTAITTNEGIPIAEIYSNTFMRIASNYPFANLYTQEYKLHSLEPYIPDLLDNEQGPGTTLVVNDNSINQYGSYSLGFLGPVPIDLIGTRFLVEGNSTFFTSDDETGGFKIGDLIEIEDAGEEANTVYSISGLFSNNFLSISPSYIWSNSTGRQPYWAWTFPDYLFNGLDFSDQDQSGYLPLVT